MKQINQEPNPVQMVTAKKKQELAAAQAQREQGHARLIRRKHAEYERAQGLGDMDIDERLIRSDFERELLKSGLVITIEALKLQIKTHERAAEEYSNVGADLKKEGAKLGAEYKELGERLNRNSQKENEAWQLRMHETLALPKLRGELEAYLSVLEDLGRGVDVRLYKAPDLAHMPRRQPVQQLSVFDIAGVTGLQNLTERQVRKILTEFEKRSRTKADLDFAAQMLAYNVGIKVEDIKYLPQQNGPKAA